MRWVDYREKLGIGFNDDSKAEMLSNNIGTFLDSYIKGFMYTSNDYKSFCLNTGIKPETRYELSYCIKKHFSMLTTIPELVSYYVAFANTVKDQRSSKEYLIPFINKQLNDLGIPFETIEDNDGVFIFPKGAKELDDALVSEPLEWLKDYPNARKTWISALKDYAQSSDEKASDVADKFRKALETFFQEYFDSAKSLENLISEYGDKLNGYRVPNEISNNFKKLLELYTTYNNNYAKHHDKTSPSVLEFILYQTGNIMRLLITLKKEHEGTK